MEPGAGSNCPEERKAGAGRHADQQRGGLCSPSASAPRATPLRPPEPPRRGGLSEPLARALLATADPELLCRLPAYPTRRPSHQAVLCPPPQESKCSDFPAKTGARHTVANARALTVKQGGALSGSRSSAAAAPQVAAAPRLLRGREEVAAAGRPCASESRAAPGFHPRAPRRRFCASEDLPATCPVRTGTRGPRPVRHLEVRRGPPTAPRSLAEQAPGETSRTSCRGRVRGGPAPGVDGIGPGPLRAAVCRERLCSSAPSSRAGRGRRGQVGGADTLFRLSLPSAL